MEETRTMKAKCKQCSGKAHSRGLCAACYAHVWRAGKVAELPTLKRGRPIKRGSGAWWRAEAERCGTAIKLARVELRAVMAGNQLVPCDSLRVVLDALTSAQD
jgi:hypothetical protein